jgi:hypothetical protein
MYGALFSFLLRRAPNKRRRPTICNLKDVVTQVGSSSFVQLSWHLYFVGHLACGYIDPCLGWSALSVYSRPHGTSDASRLVNNNNQLG